MLTIAQITDLHVTTGDDPLNAARNAERLGQVLDAVHALRPRPAAIIVSGDLVDRGRVGEYRALKPILDRSEIPLHLGVGNHDRRAPLLEVFGAAVPTDEGGFVQYAVDLGGLRLIMCDTLDEGREGGGFCEDRAAWLARTLDAQPQIPTVIALHHPPIPSGIQWMDPPADAPWLSRLGAVIAGREQVRGLVCGHVHRAFHGLFAGQLVTVSAASSIQLTLDLTSIDPRVPDGREILVEEPPGFSLLMWNGGVLTTHACVAGDYPSAVDYTVPFARD